MFQPVGASVQDCVDRELRREATDAFIRRRELTEIRNQQRAEAAKWRPGSCTAHGRHFVATDFRGGGVPPLLRNNAV